MKPNAEANIQKETGEDYENNLIIVRSFKRKLFLANTKFVSNLPPFSDPLIHIAGKLLGGSLPELISFYSSSKD